MSNRQTEYQFLCGRFAVGLSQNAARKRTVGDSRMRKPHRLFSATSKVQREYHEERFEFQ